MRHWRAAWNALCFRALCFGTECFRPAWLALWLALGGLALSSSVRAEPAGTREQAAEALFQQGRELLDVGNYAAACQRFEASQRLDPGLGTLLFLGECYDKLGKSASAWRAFSDAAQLASRKGDEERGRLARIRASALEPSVPQLRVRVATATRRLASVEYTLNGLEVAAHDLEQPLRVDAGRALLRVTAPGHQRWETEIEILEGASLAVVDVPELVPLTPAAAPVVAVPAATGSRGAAAPVVAESHPGRGLRNTGMIVGALGLGGVGTGSYFAVRAFNETKRSKSPDRCPLPDRCYQSGITLRNQARDHAHLADLGIGIGASLLAGGVLLYLLAPDAESVTGAELAASQWVALDALRHGALVRLEHAF